jgi:hypothetical protein
MGATLSASCGACGHSAHASQGRGFASDETPAPVICHACGDVRSADVAANQPTCFKCGSADVTPMADLRAPDEAAEQPSNPGRFIVAPPDGPGGRYLCPACGKHELRFHVIGLWD